MNTTNANNANANDDENNNNSKRAPIRQRFAPKRSKTSAPPAFSAEDKAALLPKLKALRAKHAPRALELARAAADALRELCALEDAMDDEARALHPRYARDIRDYKLTFEHEYKELAEECDDDAPFLDAVLDVVDAVAADAAEALAEAEAEA